MSSYGHYGPLDAHGNDQLEKELRDRAEKLDNESDEKPTTTYYIINLHNDKIVKSFSTIEDCEWWIDKYAKDPHAIATHLHTITPVFNTTKELVRS